jgi:hypothetical protein
LRLSSNAIRGRQSDAGQFGRSTISQIRRSAQTPHKHIGLDRRRPPARRQRIDRAARRVLQRLQQSRADAGRDLMALLVDTPADRPRRGEARAAKRRPLAEAKLSAISIGRSSAAPRTSPSPWAARAFPAEKSAPAPATGGWSVVPAQGP